MMQSELFKRYMWLVDLIYRNDGITRDEINRRWSRSQHNTDGESEIPEREFHRYKNAISNLFGINIVCNRAGTSRGYYIDGRDEIENDEIKSWIIKSFAVNTLLGEAQDLKHRILLESTPSGQQYLTDLVEAMRNSIVIDLQYQSFSMVSPAPYRVEPYCLKVYKQRWYLLARRVDTDKIRTFALDRIKDFKPTDVKFELPADFDADEYYAQSIGIIVEENVHAQRIIFSASNGQQDYVRSLPLHPSLREIEKRADKSTFELYVKPSYDLIQEFLRYGEDLQVHSPAWLRERFRDIAHKMNQIYNCD